VLALENLYCAELALGDYDSVLASVSDLLTSTKNLQTLVGYESLSTEGKVFNLQRSEIDRLLVTAYQWAGAAAIGKKDWALAEDYLHKALEIEPRRMTAIWLLANLQDLRGNREAGDKLRASILEIKPKARPFLENAAAWATLYFHNDKMTLLPSLYLGAALPSVPNS
jgi:hypothetical protein